MKIEEDNRLTCSDEKKAAIKATRFATSVRRQNQVVKVFECKIVEKRLNNKQREELERLFLEGKWFYNHVLNIKNSGTKLRQINSTTIKNVRHFDKDRNELVSNLETLSS